MQLITVATHSQGYYPALQASCARFNVQMTVLGWGCRWRGFGWKLQLVATHLSTLPRGECVVVIDAFDTLLVSGVHDLAAQFSMANLPFICAAERRHRSAIWNTMQERIFGGSVPSAHPATEYQYLNAGAWISTAGYALDLLREREGDRFINDQKFFADLFATGRVFIDDWCNIFVCIRSEADLSITQNSPYRVASRRTGAHPCIVHAPAGVSLRTTTKALGYPDSRYRLPHRLWKYAYSVWALGGTR
jgi:hypothetical protein